MKLSLDIMIWYAVVSKYRIIRDKWVEFYKG